MPPVKARPPKVFGQLTAAEEIEGNFGQQIRVTLKQANPDATTDRLFFFPYSDDPKSKWIKFVESLTRFIGDINSSDEMLLHWVEITEMQGAPFKGQDGEMHNITLPTITATFESEQECRQAWSKYQADRGATPVSGSEAPKASAPIDPTVIPMLKQMYVGTGKNDEAFLQAVKTFGFTDTEAVLRAVKG